MQRERPPDPIGPYRGSVVKEQALSYRNCTTLGSNPILSAISLGSTVRVRASMKLTPAPPTQTPIALGRTRTGVGRRRGNANRA
ncbi:MAG: hypothetical protein H6Q90_2488 [Deltaproteobacteria bacterium]|nr:hypothetical protein [Deltaproteobacteria bacterium]